MINNVGTDIVVFFTRTNIEHVNHNITRSPCKIERGSIVGKYVGRNGTSSWPAKCHEVHIPAVIIGYLAESISFAFLSLIDEMHGSYLSSFPNEVEGRCLEVEDRSLSGGEVGVGPQFPSL